MHRVLYKIHAWIGLALAPVLFVICLSGTIAVFGPEIDWLADDAWRVEVRDRPYDWNAIYAGVQAAHPRKRIDFILAPRRPGFAARVLVTPIGGEYLNVLVNPYTGAVQATTSYWNAWRFLRSFHRRLMLPNPVGIVAATGFGLFVLVSLITGILAYRKWWRIGLRVRWRQRLRVLLGDLHRALGLACFLVALPVALTGLWYMVELIRPPASEAGARIDAASQAAGQPGATPPLNRMAATAGEQFPQFEVGRIGFRGRDAPLWIGGQTGNWFLRDAANVVAFNPVTGERLAVRAADDHSVYQLLSHIANPVHFGTWGGLATMALWFVGGLGLSLSILVGSGIWYLRSAPGKRGPDRGRVVSLAIGLLVTVGLLAASIVYGVGEYRYWQQRLGAAPVLLGSGRVDGGEASVFAVYDDDSGTVDRLVVQYPPGTPALQGRSLELRLEPAAGSGVERRAFDWTGLDRREARLPAGWTWTRLAAAERIVLDDGEHSLDLAAAVSDPALLMRRAARPHPARHPAPAYVWLVIGAFATATVAALTFWLWILLRRRRTVPPAGFAASGPRRLGASSRTEA